MYSKRVSILQSLELFHRIMVLWKFWFLNIKILIWFNISKTKKYNLRYWKFVLKWNFEWLNIDFHTDYVRCPSSGFRRPALDSSTTFALSVPTRPSSNQEIKPLTWSTSLNFWEDIQLKITKWVVAQASKHKIRGIKKDYFLLPK